MIDFNKIVERRLRLTAKILLQKEREYAQDGNRFHNFDVAAEIDGETPEQALWGMAKKHLVSIIDIKNHPQGQSYAHVDEKIGDMIDYLILLEGLLARRRQREKEAAVKRWKGETSYAVKATIDIPLKK